MFVIISVAYFACVVKEFSWLPCGMKELVIPFVCYKVVPLLVDFVKVMVEDFTHLVFTLFACIGRYYYLFRRETGV